MKKNICLILLLFIGISIQPAFAENPGFKCKTKMSKVEKTICNNLYIALLDGTMSDVYAFKYIDKEDQLKWLNLRSINPDQLIKQYEDRIYATFEDLITKHSKVNNFADLFLKLGKINSTNIYKYKHIIYQLQSKIKIDEILLSLEQPIDLFYLTWANNLLVNDGSVYSNEISYHILDLNNDGRLDLIEDDVSGTARISNIENYCLNETQTSFTKCKSQWSDELHHGSKVWKEDDYGNDPPAMFFIGNGFYFLENKFITKLGYVIKNKTVNSECSASWIRFVKDGLKTENLFREEDKISRFVNECSANKSVSKSLIELAVKAELYQDCRKIIGVTKNTNNEVEGFRKTCFFKKYSKEKIEKMSFVDICKSDNKFIDPDVKYILQSILSDFDLDINIKRDKILCADIYKKIKIKKKLTLGFCRIANLDDFSFLNKLPELDSLEILEGGQGVCGSIGYIKLKNISVLEKLKLKKLKINLLYNDYVGKKDFWDYLSTTSIKNIDFNGEYFCEYTLKEKEFKKLNFLAQNKNTKFTCDGVEMK